MFGRRAPADEEPGVIEDTEPAPITGPFPTMTPEQKMERYLSTPSSLATRKATREATGRPDRPPPQLVSLGTTEHVQRTPRHGSSMPGDDVQVIEIELYIDRTDATRRYYRRVGDTTIWPMFDDQPAPEQVTKLGRVDARGFRSGLHPPTLDGAEKVTRIT